MESIDAIENTLGHFLSHTSSSRIEEHEGNSLIVAFHTNLRQMPLLRSLVSLLRVKQGELRIPLSIKPIHYFRRLLSPGQAEDAEVPPLSPPSYPLRICSVPSPSR